nr:hypothetical protein [Pseudomonas corrugata]
MNPNAVRYVWWNTRLTPPRGEGLAGDDRLLVRAAVLELLQADFHFIGLCEVSQKDMDEFSEALAGGPFVVSAFTGTTDAPGFGFGLIYDATVITIMDHEYLMEMVRGGAHRIALRLGVSLVGGDTQDVYLVHWSSRLNHPEESATREFFGSALNRSIAGRRNAGVPNTIVLGDFNDEPFNLSVTEGLRSTRESSRAARRSDLLYNPFWRHMVPLAGYSPNVQAVSPSGSYYLRSHQLHRWRMLDQALFSSSFVSTGDWLLYEEGTRVLVSPILVNAVESRKSKIDHLPIVAEIRRK